MRRINFIKIGLLAFTCLAGGLFSGIMAQSAVEIEFKNDTTRVEQKYRASMDKDYSTMGMITATIQYEEDYDALLNKYYKKLLSSVKNEESKTLVRETQRNWIKLRDSDKKLIRAIKGETYEEMGGGTMWGIIAASQQADITRERVLNIFRLLTFGDVGR